MSRVAWRKPIELSCLLIYELINYLILHKNKYEFIISFCMLMRVKLGMLPSLKTFHRKKDDCTNLFGLLLTHYLIVHRPRKVQYSLIFLHPFYILNPSFLVYLKKKKKTFTLLLKIFLSTIHLHFSCHIKCIIFFVDVDIYLLF